MVTKPSPQSANLSLEQMQNGIAKLDRCISKLEKFEIKKITKERDPLIEALEDSIEQTLSDIFGTGTSEFNRYKDIAELYVPNFSYGYNPNLSQIHSKFQERINRAILLLNNIKDGFSEKIELEELNNKDAKTQEAYKNLNLHPVVDKAASQLYRDRHYSEAIEKAVKALNEYVRQLSGSKLDGVSLMQHVFSVKNPILKFNELINKSDEDEHSGFMNLLCGAVTGFRNPRSHRITTDDTPEMAYEIISFISLLAKLVSKAKI